MREQGRSIIHQILRTRGEVRVLAKGDCLGQQYDQGAAQHTVERDAHWGLRSVAALEIMTQMKFPRPESLDPTCGSGRRSGRSSGQGFRAQRVGMTADVCVATAARKACTGQSQCWPRTPSNGEL